MGQPSWKDVQLDQVLFEITRAGSAYRICAIDVRTNTEVVMAGDPRYGMEMLKRMAMRKLAYVIAKKRNAGEIR